MFNTPQKGTLDKEVQKCVDACIRCYEVCTTTATYCMQQGGMHAELTQLLALLDCAEMCRVSANFMLRGSASHLSTCALCQEICTTCAESCEQIPEDDVLRRCAEECRACAEACERMTGIHAAH